VAGEHRLRCRTWRVDPEIVSGDFMARLSRPFDVIFLLGVSITSRTCRPACGGCAACSSRKAWCYVETQMSQIEHALPIFEYASDIYPTWPSRTRRTWHSWESATSCSRTTPAMRNLAHSYDFEYQSLSGPHNLYTLENPYRRFFKLTKRD
jgi:hypothetical protein